MTATSKSNRRAPRSLPVLWLGILGPPVVWLIQFEIRFASAGRPPSKDRLAWSTGVAIAAAVIIVILAAVARREHRVAADSPLDEYGGTVGRNRFMAALGLMSAALFFLLTAGQTLAEFFISAGPQ